MHLAMCLCGYEYFRVNDGWCIKYEWDQVKLCGRRAHIRIIPIEKSTVGYKIVFYVYDDC